MTEVDDYSQEDSLSDDEAILIVPGIDTVADLSSIVEAVPTIDGSTARRCIAIVTNERRASYVIPLHSS